MSYSESKRRGRGHQERRREGRENAQDRRAPARTKGEGGGRWRGEGEVHVGVGKARNIGLMEAGEFRRPRPRSVSSYVFLQGSGNVITSLYGRRFSIIREIFIIC